MIKNLLIIAIIIGVVIFSQHPFFRVLGQNTYSWIERTAQPYTSKSVDWLQQKAYPAIGGEVEKRINIAGQEINQQVNIEKEKISQTIAEKIKNYFSGVIDSIFFPNKNSSQNNNQEPAVQKCIDACQIK